MHIHISLALLMAFAAFGFGAVFGRILERIEWNKLIREGRISPPPLKVRK